MGMNGWLAGGEIAAGLEMAAAGQRALSDANSFSRVVDQLVAIRKDLDVAVSDNAANYCEKHALRAALAKFDPKHPLLVNKSLQERIQNAGEKVLTITGKNSDVAEAGRTFKY